MLPQMVDDARFLLQPTRWDPGDAVARPLTGRPRAGMPWLTIVVPDPDGGPMGAPMRSLFSTEMVHRYVNAASVNLTRTPGGWSVIERGPGLFGLLRRPLVLAAEPSTEIPLRAASIEGPDGGVAVAELGVPLDLTAERILDRELLREAQERLQADRLALAVPRRGVLMAHPADPRDLVEVVRFQERTIELYGRAGSHALSPLLFAVAGGELLGVLEVAEDAMELEELTPRGW